MPPKRLLVVDDDPTTRFALRTLLSRQGWSVSTASTVAEALARLADDPACPVMILDLDLPDGRGEVVLRTVREGNLPTRVAVCSGVVDPRRIAEVIALGPAGMFAKPIDLDPVMHLCAGAAVR